MPNLYKLKIENNHIKGVDDLKGLQLPKLRKLGLFGNPLCGDDKEYIGKVFELLPHLKCVDRVDKDNNEVESTLYNEEDGYPEDFEDEDEFDGDGEFEDEDDEEDDQGDEDD